MNRRSLYRCRHDRRLAGVASGLAEFFDIDVSLVRILWVLSVLIGGMGILLYVALAIIVPLEPESFTQPGMAPEGDPTTAEAAGTPAEGTGWHRTTVPYQHRERSNSGLGATFVGVLLILFGGLALIDGFLPGWADHGRFLWPAFILGVGALLVITAMRRRPTEP